MNGRLYDPMLHRFLMPDNFVQDHYSSLSYNRYSYVLNNPLMYADFNGEEPITLIVIGVAALVGAYMGGAQANGTYNPFKWDWGSGKTWGGLGGGAVIGAVSGYAAAAVAASMMVGGTSALLSTAVGGAAGGGISGGGFSVLPGGDGKVLKGIGIGAVSGFAGGYAGGAFAKIVGNVAINGHTLFGPAARGLMGGYAGGFTGGLIATGDLSLAHKQGKSGGGMGAIVGGLSGMAAGMKYARENNMGAWSGKYKNSVSVGGPQSKIDIFGPDLNSGTITKNSNFDIWPDSLEPYLGRDIPNPAALEFNNNWINNVMDSDFRIYNWGRTGYSPFYNGTEMNAIHFRNYQYVQPAYGTGYFGNRIRISIW